VQVVTDFAFFAPATLEAEEHSKFDKETGRSTYMYEFAYRQSFFKYKPWVAGSHNDDLFSIFGEPFLKSFRERILQDDWSRTDLQVKNIIQHYYSNFAYTGNPNEGPHTDMPAFWPTFNTTDRSYIRFQRKGVAGAGDAEPRKQGDEQLHRSGFWNNLFYKVAVPKTYSTMSASTASADLMKDVKDFMFALDASFTQIEEDIDNEDYHHILQVLEGLLQHIPADMQM